MILHNKAARRRMTSQDFFFHEYCGVQDGNLPLLLQLLFHAAPLRFNLTRWLTAHCLAEFPFFICFHNVLDFRTCGSFNSTLYKACCFVDLQNVKMFSACNISGLFLLTNGSQDVLQNHSQLYTPGNQWSTSSTGDHFVFYDTHVTSLDGTNISARVHVASFTPEVVHPDSTIALIVGSLYFEGYQSAVIIAKHIKVIAGDLSSSIPPIPAFFDTHFNCLGTVCGEALVLEDKSIVFPITIDAYMLNEFKHFRVM